MDRRLADRAGLASAAGIMLLFFSFNLFVLPIATDLGVSRGTAGSIQALVIADARGSPVIGYAFKRFSAERNLERAKGFEPSTPTLARGRPCDPWGFRKNRQPLKIVEIIGY